jgi:hypothetical protein
MIRTGPGSMFRLLSTFAAIGLLTSCGRQPTPARQAPVRTAQNDVAEVDALIAATKQHPSLAKGSQNAGAPIHVDPFPHSSGAPPHPHSAK